MMKCLTQSTYLYKNPRERPKLRKNPTENTCPPVQEGFAQGKQPYHVSRQVLQKRKQDFIKTSLILEEKVLQKED